MPVPASLIAVRTYLLSDGDSNGDNRMSRRHLSWAEFWFLLFVVAMIGIAFPVKADSVTLSWTNPTGTEECVAGPTYTNPGGTRIWQLVADIPDPGQTIESHVLLAVKPGTYDYVATTYDDAGVESRVSGKATKTVTEWVVTDTRARIVAKTTNSVILPVVGTIPLGTACDVNLEITGPVFADDGITIEARTFYAVDVALVTFTGVGDALVIAECG